MAPVCARFRIPPPFFERKRSTLFSKKKVEAHVDGGAPRVAIAEPISLVIAAGKSDNVHGRVHGRVYEHVYRHVYRLVYSTSTV